MTYKPCNFYLSSTFLLKSRPLKKGFVLFSHCWYVDGHQSSGMTRELMYQVDKCIPALCSGKRIKISWHLSKPRDISQMSWHLTQSHNMHRTFMTFHTKITWHIYIANFVTSHKIPWHFVISYTKRLHKSKEKIDLCLRLLVRIPTELN